MTYTSCSEKPAAQKTAAPATYACTLSRDRHGIPDEVLGDTDSVNYRGVVLKKKWGTPETRLRQRFVTYIEY